MDSITSKSWSYAFLQDSPSEHMMAGGAPPDSKLIEEVPEIKFVFPSTNGPPPPRAFPSCFQKQTLRHVYHFSNMR